jgi:hypothetical protein
MRTVEQGREHLGRERAVSDGVQRCHRSDLGAPKLTTTSYGAGPKRLHERDEDLNIGRRPGASHLPGSVIAHLLQRRFRWSYGSTIDGPRDRLTTGSG